MIANRFQRASFRGVSFEWTDFDTSGGRKRVVHDFPNKDERVVEDLGQLRKSFRVTGLITQAERGEKYFERRDALVAALESKGLGTLVHPTLGSIEVMPGGFSLQESQKKLGVATFNMDVVEGVIGANPKSAPKSNSQVRNISDLLIGITIKDLAANFIASIDQPEAVKDALSVIRGASDIMADVLAGVATVKSLAGGTRSERAGLAAFLETATNFRLTLPEKIFDGALVGTDVVALSEAFDLVPASPADGFLAAIRLFDLAPGSGAADIAPVTWVERERKNLNEALRRTFRLNAWSLAARNAARMSYGNTEELGRSRDQLEERYRIIENEEELAADQSQALKRLRETARQFFDGIEVNVYRVGPVPTKQGSLLQIAFDYYGDAALRPRDLLALNPSVRNAAWVPNGELQILRK